MMICACLHSLACVGLCLQHVQSVHQCEKSIFELYVELSKLGSYKINLKFNKSIPYGYGQPICDAYELPI